MSDNYQESVVFTNLVIDPGRGSTRQDRVPGIAVDAEGLSVEKGLEKLTHAYETRGLGGGGADDTETTVPNDETTTTDVAQPQTINDALLHLRKLRREKAIIRDVDGPIERLDKLKTETDILEKEMKQLYEGRHATLQLCLNSETITEEERDRLQTLAELENRDLMMLEGIELKQSFEAIRNKLETLENDEGVKALIAMLDAKELKSFGDKYNTQKFNLLKAQLDKSKTGGDTATESTSATVPTSSLEQLSDLAVRFAKLDERLHQIEQIVGMDVVEAMSFPFQDIPTAICHLTERMLLLDQRKLDAIHERASELSKELDKLLSTKAHVVFGGEGPSLQALTSEKKIETLYAIATRWRSTADSLPKLVQKMKFLSVLSRDTAEVQTRLNAVETDVTDVKEMLQSSQKSLELLNSKVTEQIELMSQVLDKLNKRAFE